MKRVILGLLVVMTLPQSAAGEDAPRTNAVTELEQQNRKLRKNNAEPLSIHLPWATETSTGPGLETPAGETPGWGPADICVTRKGVWVADSVRSRVSLWSAKGELVEEREVPFAPGAIWCDSHRGFWAFNGTWEMGYMSESASSGMRYPLPPKTTAVVTGPAQRPWAVLADGHSVPVTGKAGFKRAMPLGSASAGHAVGRKVGEKTGEIIIWNWKSRPEVKGDGPARILSFTTKGKLGSIQPLGADEQLRVYVHLEVLADQLPIQVKHQIVRVSQDGSREQIEWAPSSRYPHLDGIFLSPSGNLYRFSSLENGFVVHEFAQTDWKRGVK